MAVAARSQGKHKQRIWVNISMAGIKIIDEKSGVSTVYSQTLVSVVTPVKNCEAEHRKCKQVCLAAL